MIVLWLQKKERNGSEDNLDEDVPELASLSNRFSYFENFKEEEQKKKDEAAGGDNDAARRECKARSVLNKFKEMETKALNGEDDGKITILQPPSFVSTNVF